MREYNATQLFNLVTLVFLNDSKDMLFYMPGLSITRITATNLKFYNNPCCSFGSLSIVPFDRRAKGREVMHFGLAGSL